MIWTPERKRLALRSLSRWHGTPHHNRIAVRGVGVDCIKLVYEVLIDCGILDRVEFSGYDVDSGLWTESTKLQDTILRCLHSVWVEESFEFGDIFILKTGNRSAHCGLYTDDGNVWHALGNRCVTKSDFALWRHEIKGMVRVVAPGFRVNPATISFN